MEGGVVRGVSSSFGGELSNSCAGSLFRSDCARARVFAFREECVNIPAGKREEVLARQLPDTVHGTLGFPARAIRSGARKATPGRFLLEFIQGDFGHFGVSTERCGSPVMRVRAVSAHLDGSRERKFQEKKPPNMHPRIFVKEFYRPWKITTSILHMQICTLDRIGVSEVEHGRPTGGNNPRRQTGDQRRGTDEITVKKNKFKKTCKLQFMRISHLLWGGGRRAHRNFSR